MNALDGTEEQQAKASAEAAALAVGQPPRGAVLYLVGQLSRTLVQQDGGDNHAAISQLHNGQERPDAFRG